MPPQYGLRDRDAERPARWYLDRSLTENSSECFVLIERLLQPEKQTAPERVLWCADANADTRLAIPAQAPP
jgi:hypothetical protein